MAAAAAQLPGLLTCLLAVCAGWPIEKLLRTKSCWIDEKDKLLRRKRWRLAHCWLQ
jgi:hypothetical protein